ncbi:TPA: ead/Ea22-like family protein [Escherichia coli]
MSKIDYQALREAAERAIPAMERLLMLPVDDDLLSEQELKDYGVDIDALNAFKFLTGPETVLASLEAEPVAWRYRYVKKGVTDSQGEPWVGDWKYVPTKEDCNDRPSYEIQALFTAPPVPVTSEGLVKAVRFYEQVKRENPPVETGAWKDAVDWVLEEACQAVNIRIKGE